MTIEEFKNNLKLQYIGGMRFTNGALRKYHDKEKNISAELDTPFNEKTQEWGKGKYIYYFKNSKIKHDSLEGLYNEWLKTREMVKE